MELTINVKDTTSVNAAEKISKLENYLSGLHREVKGEKKVTITRKDQDVTRRNPDVLQKSHNIKSYTDLVMNIKDFNYMNARQIINKAIRTMSFTFDIPLKAAKGEAFLFKSQEELTDKWCKYFSEKTKELYNIILDYCGLPECNVMAKAGNDLLKHKGKIIYSPETGEPITMKDWNNFIDVVEKFLNRNIKGTEKRIVLDSVTLGRLLDRLVKTNSVKAIKNKNLSELQYNTKSFDWIAGDIKNIKNTFGDTIDRDAAAKIAVMEQSAGMKITRLSDDLKNSVNQVLIDGVKNKKSKSQISQDLFYTMIGKNRDFQKIADTEIQTAVNNSYLAEEVYNAPAGENIYFERVEIIDENTCDYCRKMNGKIAVWSNTPVTGKVTDKIADLAIWEGKEWNGKKINSIAEAPTAIFHPYCRGVWIRHDPKFSKIQNDDKEENLDKLYFSRGEEWQEAKSKLNKSLTYSGHKLQGRTNFNGLNISIENRKGSVRSGTDKNGHKWAIKMNYAYGYIRGSVGTDGDHVDCYIGPNKNAKKVYIIHQQDPDTKKYDEDKCMLGFNTADEAKKAYLSQYDRPGFFQSMDIMDFEEFKEKVTDKKQHGKVLLKKSIYSEIIDKDNKINQG